MSSPTASRFARPGSSSGGVYPDSPRSSIDRRFGGSSNGHGESSSRRPSGASTHQSHYQHPHTSSPQMYSSPLNGSSSSSRPYEDTNGSLNHGLGIGGSHLAQPPHSAAVPGPPQRGLPRITTSNAGEDGEGGPRSAPPRPPSFNGLVPRDTGPLRSSSSPDPWTTTQNSSGRSSPEHRPSVANANGPPPPLGPTAFPVPFIRGQSPNPANNTGIPARSSSFAADTERGSTSQIPPGRGFADTNDSSHLPPPPPPSDSAAKDKERVGRSRGEPTYCGQCSQVVHGQFVRAMGKVYHLNCFRCKDCNKVVAQKFFPVEEGDTQYPLCERDYFARLNLICANCDQALRSSYITACGAKYHVEHFTCTECDVIFGPNDSYYEHDGKVYCHFHYSTKFAVKCVGCETAILKQFVEMNRNGRDECWHPECYMISKFWNVRLASKNFNTPANSAVSSSVSLLEMTPGSSSLTMTSNKSPMPSPGSTTTELGPEELKEKQDAMEIKVLQIWHVLSGYEESSAALIGEMLRAVNARNLLEIILLAEKFILHVETLFAVIDDLEAQFNLAGVKGMSHAREAKQLCRKLVNLFSLMSQIQPDGNTPNNQDLFNLITQLAHYLKILIRIALTGSIKLERDQSKYIAMTNALARLNLLALDGSDPTVPKRGDWPELEPPPRVEHKREGATTPGNGTDEEQLKRAIDSLTRRPLGYLASTQNLAYGYRSLAVEVTGETTLRGPAEEDFVPPEVCVHCNLAIEEDCVRLGMFTRWHSSCVQCVVCGDRAAPIPVKDKLEDESSMKSSPEDAPLPARPPRPPPQVERFSFEPAPNYGTPTQIFCSNHRTANCQNGFEAVSRLEQYAFLLHIAMRRLYVHFRIHYELPSVRGLGLDDAGHPHREHDIKRMKSVTLDRKLSSTARLPQRSLVIESPAGRMADENGQVSSTRSQTAITPLQIATDVRIDSGEEGPQSSTVDVIRPAFARNNTSVLIINENNGPSDLADEVARSLALPKIQDDDAITLGDIPLLADQAIRQTPSNSDGSQYLLATLNPLQSLILRHFALLQLQKTGIGHLIELDDVLELLEARKSQWWNKLFKGNNKKDQKKKGVFGVPLEILVDRTGSDSQQGASNAQLRVPEFIEDIISTMRQMDMAIEGIFRKNGNIRKLQQISEALDKDSTTANLSDENPVQLAALLKKFLRELPDPLLTFRLHKLFCAAASLPNLDDRKRVLHLLITLLPRANRDCMEVLFVFLKWVGTFSYKDEETGNRMDMANLATVICPSILYAKGANAARDESFVAISAVQELLENQDEYYVVPPDLLFVIQENIYNIFAKELDLPPKEIHRHCSKYMQARGQPSMTQASRMPASSSGQIRERQSDSRMSVHRSDNNLAGNLPDVIPGSTPMPQPIIYRTNASPGPSPGPQGQSGSRPTSWIQNMPGSNSSIPTPSGFGSPGGGGWRGTVPGPPFQGTGNGSRNSSRGSAPSSPGPEERRSLQVERERTRTPVQQGEYR